MQGKSVKRINTKDELEKYKIEGKWNGYIIADNVDNIHEEGGYKFAYIGNEVVIDNESVRIRIAVKKKIGSNHFWIHNIDEYKNDSELLGPSRKTENKETQSRINTIS